MTKDNIGDGSLTFDDNQNKDNKKDVNYYHKKISKNSDNNPIPMDSEP